MTIKKIGLERPLLKGQINFPILLAPMVGLSHTSFRRLLKEYLPEGAETLWPTEMLNSRRLPREILGATPETVRHPSDNGILVPQILGNEELPITESIQRLQQWGALGIDINMGCPVTKALKHNYGVALMGDSLYAAQVVAMAKRASSLPVSVKLRAAESGQAEDLLKFVRGLEDAGADWLTLHPRRAEQKRRGEADWSQISWLRQRISCPLIGNGDVQVVEDVERMFLETGCDMVMVGRALTARPWLLWQWGEARGWPPPSKYAHCTAPRSPAEEAEEYGHILHKLLLFMQEDFHREELILRKFRFFVKTGSVWLDFGQELVGRVHGASSIEILKEELQDFFAHPLRMSPRTELRQ